MKRNLLLFVLAFVITLTTNSQLAFRFDNTIYKAVYLNEAFRMMDSAKNYLLLDVRSPGEYSDTSRFTALNIGHFKGARNINIDDIPAHLTELKNYSDEPIFIYCSHSQRSRRVSKILVENGFKKVYNINGGMSLVNEMDDKLFPYKSKVLETSTSYKNISSYDAANLIKNTPGLVIIDIRSEKEFASKDSLMQNNIGYLKNAINIPQAVFAEKFDSYKIPREKPVLLYDMYGNHSMDVVSILTTKGFNRIYNLYAGFAGFSCNHAVSKDLRSQLIADAPAFNFVDPKAVIDLLTQHPNTIIIDARPVTEFENKSSVSFHNLGQIKGAVNITTPGALEKFMQGKDKSVQLLVYPGMSDDFGPEACTILIKKGFKNINFLFQGIYQFVWATANVEDCRSGKAFLVNHDGLY